MSRAHAPGWPAFGCWSAAVFGAISILSVAGLVAPPAGRASQLIDRNASLASLEINARGEAMITYQKAGHTEHVLAWGAINALSPNADARQVAFKLDYSGGYGKYHQLRYWQTSGWSCRPYHGPPIGWEVTVCGSPDGSYWALQAWQRDLPDFGVVPTVQQQAWELRLSHWTGAPPVLSITLDWSYHRFHHLFGTLSYGGSGVYGFHSTAAGVPQDNFGRNIYLDTFDSAYGPGWKRENSFLTHKPRGSFCYGLYPHGTHPAGTGTQYRATVVGPGVTPDIIWQEPARGPYSVAEDGAANTEQRQLGDPACSVN